MNTTNKPFDLAFYLSPNPKDLDAELEVCQELGVSSIGTNGWMEWRDRDAIRTVGERDRAHGMKVASCHSSIGLGWPGTADGGLEDNRRIVDCAAEWGCPSTVWHFRWLRSPEGDTHYLSMEKMDALSQAEVDRAMEEVLLPTCDYAVSCGVSINLENMPLMISLEANPYKIIEFIRKFNHPGLGLILDSGHGWINGYDPADAIRAAGPLLRDTHFHDNLGSRGFPKDRKMSWKCIQTCDLHLAPGLGTICWMEVVRALRETGFPGPVVFEGAQIIGDPAHKTIAGLRRRIKLAIDMWRAFEDMATGCPDPVHA